MRRTRWLRLVCLAALAVAACAKPPQGEAPSQPSPAPSAAPAPVVEAPPAAPPATPSAAELTRLEVAWADALHRRDRAALERIVAADFLITGVGSSAQDPVGTRQEWLENAEKYPWPLHTVRDVRVAQASADTVVVKCLWSGNYPPESLTLTGGLVDLLVTDVWARRDGNWVVVARHSSLPHPE